MLVRAEQLNKSTNPMIFAISGCKKYQISTCIDDLVTYKESVRIILHLAVDLASFVRSR